MRFDLWSKGFAQTAVDCLMAGVFEDGDAGDAALQIDAAAGGRLKKLLTRGDFGGRAGETVLVPDLPGIVASRVLLVGLGSRKTYNRKAWRRAYAAAIGALGRTSIRSAAVGIDRPPTKELDDHYFGKSVAELAGSALYRVNDLKTGKKPKAPALETIVAGPVRSAGAPATRRGFEHGNAVALGMRVHRDLANLPANVCTPTYLAERATELGRRYKWVKVKVLDEPAIRREKMGCFLAVARGSHEPPKFIVLEHRRGGAKQAPIVLVGKGITFDTGGISLKDPPGMDEMKFDMSGAAAVIGVLTLVAALGLPLHVVGLVAACENMPSGHAVKPGDIVTSAAGHTVEILNTDAEGRLILADALQYARRFEPDVVVDIATLTGASSRSARTTAGSSATTRRWCASSSTPASAATIAPGTCRSPRNTRSSSKATSRTSRTWAGAKPAPSRRPRSSASSRRVCAGRISTSQARPISGARRKAAPAGR